MVARPSFGRKRSVICLSPDNHSSGAHFMKRHIMLTMTALCLASAHAHAYADDAPCGMLESATGGNIGLREGESVNFTHGGALTHGVLHVYKDGELYHVYWQPIGGREQYVLANAGENAVRLISNPPRGEKVDTGPGVLPAQKVLSCPAL
jgi:hypothetical protein